MNELKNVDEEELMEAFQNKTNPAAKVPDDISIAAEFFGMSWKEKDLIITTRNTSVDQDKYWKYDTNQNTISVSLFKDRTGLTYYEILELLILHNNDFTVNYSP